MAVPEILGKTAPEHFSPSIFGNQKQFPVSSRISGAKKCQTFQLKREIRDEKKKERMKERKNEGKKEGTKEREKG